MKNRLNSKLEYYYGFGAGRYGEVLPDILGDKPVSAHILALPPGMA